MALKALMLRKKLDEKKAALDELRKAADGFSVREAELEQSINEAETEEEQKAVEEAVDAFEAEQKENAEKIAALEREISDMEQELSETEQKSRSAPKPTDGRKEVFMNRTAFFGMDVQQRDAFFADDGVKELLANVRAALKEKRAISGAELTIPEIVLGLVRENIGRYSKLYKHLHIVNVPGKARQNIMGSVPEAVWTEACGKLNELDLSFNNVEVDGYKVGGYFAVCNAILEDSDISLATEIINALGQAIGYALDKAWLYGKGVKMPLGIVTRLAQTEKPSDYPETAREWKDLHTSNMIAIESTGGLDFYQQFVLAAGKADCDYSTGEMFWAMNSKTYTQLVALAMSVNAAGAIVSGQTGTMPIVGGTIEKLNFIPEGWIIGGYGSLYLGAERAGTSIAQSEHVRFIEDQTVFRGTARYDGTPVIPEAFVAIYIGKSLPEVAMTFAPDVANEESDDV